MSQSINQDITPVGLLKFAAPSIIMMIFMSLYTIVDGIFISRFLGSNALSSANIVYPVVNVAIAISTMLGTGGSTIISKYLGEGKKERARKALTQFVVLALVLSFVLLIISEIFLTPISRFLGASDILLADCRMYLGTAMLFAPACMLQAVFQSFLVTAGRPGLGLALMIGAGISNMVLDYVLIVPCQMGIAGAALATGIGQCIPAVCGLCFFLFTRNELRFCRFTFSAKEIGSACYNGSSEMVSQLSNAVITFLLNIVMMSLAGENGVAAITILLKIYVTSEIEITLRVIGGKWKPLILHLLQEQGTQRYMDIFRYLENAPKKTLTSQLKELELDGIIQRNVIPTVPVQVEYSVTEHGKTLFPILDAMCEWGYHNTDGRYVMTHPTCEDE